MKPLPKKKEPLKFFCQLCGGYDEPEDIHLASMDHRHNQQLIDDARSAAPLKEVFREERWPSKR